MHMGPELRSWAPWLFPGGVPEVPSTDVLGVVGDTLLPAAMYTVFWALHQTDPHIWTTAKCSQLPLLCEFESL